MELMVLTCWLWATVFCSIFSANFLLPSSIFSSYSLLSSFIVSSLSVCILSICFCISLKKGESSKIKGDSGLTFAQRKCEIFFTYIQTIYSDNKNSRKTSITIIDSSAMTFVWLLLSLFHCGVVFCLPWKLVSLWAMNNSQSWHQSSILGKTELNNNSGNE